MPWQGTSTSGATEGKNGPLTHVESGCLCYRYLCIFNLTVILSTSAEIMEWKGLKGEEEESEGKKCSSGQNINQQTSLP